MKTRSVDLQVALVSGPYTVNLIEPPAVGVVLVPVRWAVSLIGLLMATGPAVAIVVMAGVLGPTTLDS